MLIEWHEGDQKHKGLGKPTAKGVGDGPTLKLPENNVGPTAHRLPAGRWENGSRPLGAILRNLKVSKFKDRRP